jgi:hypothetical protein
MKLLSFRGTSPGVAGLTDISIRFRLRGNYSHNEVMFEPGDGVEHLMPDGSLEPIDGAYWCASSAGTEKMPSYSPRRAGKLGGVRFKRIVPTNRDWKQTDLKSDPVKAANWAFSNQGMLYDWRLILGYVAWFFPNQEGRVICSEAAATMMGIDDPWRFDPDTVTCVAQLLLK